ncbi:copper resistance protein CopC [Arthrobacter crystallopoietes]|uniref:copper resistance CopC/CopD family protein n=1 Tax=Crystallibacter crystallopoietes TaxID=37928 RepID=UPI001305301B|nr:copper resistance protein CopC [Arthrobacter crystallopoietes]
MTDHQQVGLLPQPAGTVLDAGKGGSIPGDSAWHSRLGSAARSGWRLLVIAALAGIALLGGAGPASAHANLLFTAPAAGAAVADAPQALTLLFDEPVSAGGTVVEVSGGDAGIAMGPATLSHEGRAVEVPVDGVMAPGVYVVEWQITARDGDVMGGSYRFAVGPAAASLDPGQSTQTRGFWITAGLRWIVFAGLALGLGELVQARLLRREPGAGPRTWMLPVLLSGLAAAAGLALVLAGNGSLARGVLSPDPEALFSSRPGILALVTAGGFALAVAAEFVSRRAWLWPGLFMVVAGEALRAHPQLVNPVLGIPLSVVHLAAAAAWAGTLVYALRAAAARRHAPRGIRTVFAAYAGLAVWLFAAVAVTGTVSALLLVPLDEIATTDYGRALAIKLLLVAAVAALALLARRRLRRRAAGVKIIRPARMEAVALLVLLGLSALLTVLPMPGTKDAALAFPPPATGPAVITGALAGNVGITATASEGQLVVQLTAPQTPDGTGGTDQQYSLSGALAGPSGRTQELDMRGCGTGCYVSAATWENGSSRLTLTATAEGWTGGRAGITVAWPASPAPELLTEVVSTMAQIPEFTVHEVVTSDTTQGLGAPASLQVEGPRFLDRALYGSGTAPWTNRLPDEDGHRRLALAYPAENAYFELTLADDGRILSETLAAPHHQVTRTYIYTGHE